MGLHTLGPGASQRGGVCPRLGTQGSIAPLTPVRLTRLMQGECVSYAKAKKTKICRPLLADSVDTN